MAIPLLKSGLRLHASAKWNYLRKIYRKIRSFFL